VRSEIKRQALFAKNHKKHKNFTFRIRCRRPLVKALLANKSLGMGHIRHPQHEVQTEAAAETWHSSFFYRQRSGCEISRFDSAKCCLYYGLRRRGPKLRTGAPRLTEALRSL
jgi:hypothetical protein